MTPERLVVRTEDVIRGNLWMYFPVINVDRVKDIPADYPGGMGVPITFFDKFNPMQFEILGMTNHVKLADGREPYRRMVIRNLHPVLPEFIDLAEWFRRMDVPLDVEFFAPGELPEDAEIVYRRLEGGGSR